MKYISTFSGGKDSTAMILLILEKGLPLDEVIYAKVPEFGEIENFIKIFKEFIESKGIKFTILESDKTFEQMFYTKRKSGKFKGTIVGWPLTRCCWVHDRMKSIPLNRYLKKIGEHIQYIGYAYDEERRYKKYLDDHTKSFPLVDYKITELDTIKYLKSKGWYNPRYWWFERMGCYFCPKQKLSSLEMVYRQYPSLWKKMLKLDRDSPVSFRADGTTIKDLDVRFRYNDMKRGYKDVWESPGHNEVCDLLERYDDKQINFF